MSFFSWCFIPVFHEGDNEVLMFVCEFDSMSLAFVLRTAYVLKMSYWVA